MILNRKIPPGAASQSNDQVGKADRADKYPSATDQTADLRSAELQELDALSRWESEGGAAMRSHPSH